MGMAFTIFTNQIRQAGEESSLANWPDQTVFWQHVASQSKLDS